MEDNLVYSFNGVNDEIIKVFLPKFEIDMDTMKQIKQMSSDSGMILKNIRIMPDCHRGHGCCVGLTAQIEDKIYPRYVGVDIGCGISMYPLNIKLKSKKIPKVEQLIRDVIPMGFDKHKGSQMRDSDWNLLIERSNNDLVNLKEKFPEGQLPTKIDREWIDNMMRKVGCDVKNDWKSIGTLGGGNHYVEVNQDVDSMSNYLTVHSGSRNIGFKICCYHQAIIDEGSKFDRIAYVTQVKKIDRKFKDSKVAKELKDNVKKDMIAGLHPKYLEGQEMLNYLVDMIVGQNIASLNRVMMIRSVVEPLLGEEAFDLSLIMETKHNYIDFKRFVLRKGSISAEEGEHCIISLNMRDGILLCKGKGNPDWNYSSAHGCGRILSRGSASRLSMKTFEKEMEDVYSTCVRKETLDESPMAYRDVDLVKSCLKDSVNILKQLKPVINCKGF